MRKYITTSLLVLSMLAGITVNPGLTTYKTEAYAKAATVSNLNLCKPSIYVANKSGNTNKLCINKVAGATDYKVYRCNTKNGTYKCIGSTKSNVFKDKVNSNQKCYYKVKACKNSGSQKTTSPFSNVTTTPKATTPTPTTTPKTTTPAPTTAAPAKTTGGTTNQSNQSFANEVFKLVNQERAKAGLNALTTTSSLQNAADKRAVEIVSSFSHTRPDSRSFSTVLGDYNINYLAAGENIAYGQKTPSEVMTAWMNSPGHRANILGKQFGKVGIGVYKSSNGTYYWSQEFTN